MLRFGLVGALATLVHMIIGFMLIHSGWQALTANAVAFVTAFLVSFMGHLGYSFADQETGVLSSLWKFTIVGLIGFTCNEAILATLLAMQIFEGMVALIISTTCAAIVTFILSRVWAFRD